MSRSDLSLFFPHPKILFVDDDRDLADISSEIIKEAGAEVKVAYDGASGLVAAKSFEPDLIISDLTMPMLRGDEFLIELRKSGSKKPFILLTGMAEISHVNAALHYGAFDYLIKPVSTPVLLAVIQNALRSEYQRLLVEVEVRVLYEQLVALQPENSMTAWKEMIRKKAVAEIKGLQERKK